MKIKDVMTRDVEYIPTDTTLKQAAEKMAELDTGFLPLGNSDSDKLRGVITDRDITIRAIATGLDPNQTTVEQIKTDKVLYCFEDDDVDSAADSMHDQQVNRLIVLNNKEEKRLCGVITLGDIFRHNEEKAGNYAAKGIKSDSHGATMRGA